MCPTISVSQVLFEEPGIKLTLWGDIHGSVHSLIRTVSDFVATDSWTITDPYRYFIFLGDYMDRGAFSLETFYVLMRLKIANPSRVFLLRGDHEMHTMNMTNHFFKEMNVKYPEDGRKLVEEIGSLYNFLPVAVWLAFSDQPVPASETILYALQFVHGGMEMGIEPREFLLQAPEKRFHLLTQMSRRACSQLLTFRRPSDRQGLLESDLAYNGFMWSDFCLNRAVDAMSFNPGRGYVYSKSATELILDRYGTAGHYKICAVFRGHQHSIDQGILFHLINKEGVLGIWEDRKNKKYSRPKRPDDTWDQQPHVVPFDFAESMNLVYTLLSAPSSSLLFAVDSYVNLTIPAAHFSTWKMNQIARQIKSSPHPQT